MLQLEKDKPGAHPFDGMDGERFAVAIIGPLAADQHGDKKSLGDAPTREDGGQSLATSPAKPKKRWNEMPASQRAALLTQDDEFQRYAEDMGAPLDWGMSRTAAHTDRWLKKTCNITSKSELQPGTLAHAKYLDIEGNFQAWRQAKQLGAA